MLLDKLKSFNFHLRLMTIRIEKGRDYGCLPKKIQEEAEQYLFGREFRSLEEALKQPGFTHSPYFRVAENRTTPTNLPECIFNADLIASLVDSEIPGYDLVALRAVYSLS